MVKGTLKLNIKANPGFIATQAMKKGIYDTFVDELLETANELQQGSPVGATRELIEGWDIQYPRKEAVTFTINAKIVNTSDRAINRIAGRPPGTPPPIAPLTDWVIAKGIEYDRRRARGIAFAISKAIASRGTQRFRDKDNWAGLSPDGKFIPDGLLDKAQKRIASKLTKKYQL